MKDSFEFAKMICEQDVILFMASVDVVSFFANAPLHETIDICVNELFKNNNGIHIPNKKNKLPRMLSNY